MLRDKKALALLVALCTSAPFPFIEPISLIFSPFPPFPLRSPATMPCRHPPRYPRPDPSLQLHAVFPLLPLPSTLPFFSSFPDVFSLRGPPARFLAASCLASASLFFSISHPLSCFSGHHRSMPRRSSFSSSDSSALSSDNDILSSSSSRRSSPSTSQRPEASSKHYGDGLRSPQHWDETAAEEEACEAERAQRRKRQDRREREEVDASRKAKGKRRYEMKSLGVQRTQMRHLYVRFCRFLLCLSSPLFFTLFGPSPSPSGRTTPLSTTIPTLSRLPRNLPISSNNNSPPVNPSPPVDSAVASAVSASPTSPSSPSPASPSSSPGSSSV
jgi:hypothetical protein